MVTCRPGREAELEHRLAEVIAKTRSDPACAEYSWLQSDLRADGSIHLESEAFTTFNASEKADPCLSGPPQHHGLTEIGDAA